MLHTINAQSKQTRAKTNAINLRSSSQTQDNDPRESDISRDYDEDVTPEPALQYYNTPRNRNEHNRFVLVTADDEYNGFYGHPTATTRPLLKTASSTARSKDVTSKETVQTIRNYSKVNDDGSFTFGSYI